MLNRPELLPIVVSEAVAEQFLPVIRRQFTHAQRANHLACRKWKEAFCFLLDTLRLFPGPQIVWVAVIAIEPAHAPAPEQMRHRFVAVNRGGEFSRFWLHDLRALREDEIAAAAVGVDPTAYKVTSFVIAAAGGGVAGALLASMRDGNPTVQPDQFTFAYSFDAITMVILGGSGSVTGAILGGVFVTFTVKMIEQLQGLDAVQALKAAHPNLDLNALRMVVYAAVLIALMILRPEGLMGERELFRRTRKLGPIGKAPVEPVPVTTGAEAAAAKDPGGEARS